MFHPGWRNHSIDRLDEHFDVIVIGGGITGCGIALDSAQRGLNTLLVEKGDIASGTSSRSSKLIHGGLRYLKQMQFRITRLACRERDRLLNLNPHLVSEIRFLYPAYKGDHTPGWQIDLGLWMYDQLTGRPEKHEHVDASRVADLAPGLNVEGLDLALSFSDAMADDARLTLAVAATAHSYGAAVITRCEVKEPVISSNGRIGGIHLLDHESGKKLTARGTVVINSTGVWADAVRERLGLSGAHLRPSRGIHLILPHDVAPVQVAVSLQSPDDGRPLFLIPHPEGVLLGTTDIYHDGGLDDPRPTEEDVAYLLRAAAHAFPDRPPARADVLGAFAGLRPILDSYADNPSEASREEDIWEEQGALSVAGGKLTTWRPTAESTIDSALRLLPEHRSRHAARCATKGVVLTGLTPIDLPSRLKRHGVDPAIATAMARRLGGLAWFACTQITSDRELQPLIDGIDICEAEIRAHCQWGATLHLSDLLIRRTRIGMWRPHMAIEAVPAIRPAMCSVMGWNSRTWDNEVEAFNKALEGWQLPT